jgi:hypothetical protein
LPVEPSNTVCVLNGADSGTHAVSNPLGDRRTCRFVAVVALSALAFVGCDRGPRLYQVRGHVLYKDGSVPTGSVCLVGFQPAANSSAKIRKAATGVIGPDGAFELITRNPGDGVHPGEYDARFVIRKNGTDPATSMIPLKYEEPATSGYNNIKVDRDISELKFELEPLRGAPKK